MKPELMGSSHRVYEMVKQRIITGDFQPGQFLTELQLSQEVGLSRTPVRECLQVLQTEGWIRLVPRKGAIVSEVSPDGVRELFELRRCLERFAVMELLSSETPVDHSQLQSIIDQQSDALNADNLPLYLELDRDFHRSLLQLLGYRLFTHVIDNLGDQILRCGFRVIRREGRQEEALNEHRAVLDALAARDVTACQAAIDAHNRNTMRRSLSL